jgi:hypothetical protein
VALMECTNYSRPEIDEEKQRVQCLFPILFKFQARSKEAIPTCRTFQPRVVTLYDMQSENTAPG